MSARVGVPTTERYGSYPYLSARTIPERPPITARLGESERFDMGSNSDTGICEEEGKCLENDAGGARYSGDVARDSSGALVVPEDEEV